MQVKHYLHTALLISDLERSKHFYGTVLGLAQVDRVLKYPGVWYQLGSIQIHLIVHPELIQALNNPDKWGRNPHLAIAVADLEAAKAELLAHGCEMQLSASGRAALFTQDPDGNVIEISEG
ncbi:VOC family protein [Phormidium tenue FACHB-886]|nr:VOC family protein [Phormidium tenue FACHB-886]